MDHSLTVKVKILWQFQTEFVKNLIDQFDLIAVNHHTTEVTHSEFGWLISYQKKNAIAKNPIMCILVDLFLDHILFSHGEMIPWSVDMWKSFLPRIDKWLENYLIISRVIAIRILCMHEKKS